MTVKQISVFLENKPGKLAEFTDILTDNQIDMRALSLAETEDFGILRIIVDDVYKTSTVLKEAGYVFSITKVLAVEIPDTPGGLGNVIHIIGDSGVNIEYMYAFTTKKQGIAFMIFRVHNNEEALEVLLKNGYHTVCQEELKEL